MRMEDNWKNRTVEMRCQSCMYFINFRCRRNAPTMAGFPAVYPDDWCGEHKLGKDTMNSILEERTRKEFVKEVISHMVT